MKVHPRLATDRLWLRALLYTDAERFAELAGGRDVADSTLPIPHPLSLSMAKSMITANAASFQRGASVHFAIERRDAPGLVGCTELRDLDREHRRAELGFWVAPEQRGRGYATEAAREVVRYAFAKLGVNRVYATCMVRNPAAECVLQKVGMKKEGVLRERIRRWEVFEDVAVYSLLRSDLGGAQREASAAR